MTLFRILPGRLIPLVALGCAGTAMAATESVVPLATTTLVHADGTPAGMARIVASGGHAMIAIELEVVAPLSVFLEEPLDLERIGVDWDVPPFGNVTPPLPATDPDAADLIEVQP